MKWLRAVLLFAGGLACLALPANGSPPPIAGMTLDFMEDFQTGIDETSTWYCEQVGGDEWAMEWNGANGLATCVGTQMVRDNRETDMMTQRADFSHFVMMWDMRFMNDSWDRDRRLIHFRATNDGNPVEYTMQIGVKTPLSEYPPPTDWILIYWDGVGDYTPLTPKLDHPWVLNQWYTFKLEVFGISIKLKVWPKGQLEPQNWFVETWDPQNHSSMGRIGFGNYWLGHTDLDNIYVYVLNPVPVQPTTWTRVKTLYATR